MFALAHRFFEVAGAESGRGGQNDNVGQRDGMLISVESDELVLLRHIHAFGLAGLERVVTFVQLILGDIAHGDQFEWAGGAEGLAGGACAPSAAADQGDLEGVVAGGENARGQAGGGGEGGSCFKEITAGEFGLGGILGIHRMMI